MNIIMSAHNCEPDRGSEFETGWQAMQKLSKKCTNLTVVTRSGKNTLHKLKALDIENTVFVFFDLPPWFELLKRNSIGMQLVPWVHFKLSHVALVILQIFAQTRFRPV